MRAIAFEARSIVRSAAEPVAAGETVKAQVRRAVQALRLPAWRIRAAWYGETGCWSASALEALRAAHADMQARAAAKSRGFPEQARKMIEIANSLEAKDAEFFSAEINRLRSLAGSLGGSPSARS